jgi:hypothetical protein
MAPAWKSMTPITIPLHGAHTLHRNVTSRDVQVFAGPGVLIGNMYSWFPEFKAASKHIFLGINDAM